MTCKICAYVFHAKCEGVSAQQFSLFRELDKLKTHYEWLLIESVSEGFLTYSCSTCRKVDIMNILKSVHAMQDKIEKLELEVESLKQANSAHSVVSSSAELGVGSRQNSVLSEAVNEALDIEHRKMNLIVSGIPVSNEKSDTELLHALLEDPIFDISGTISVCNVQQVGHSGLLLITFGSLECKRAVLRSASRLRASAISSHRDVYISPDLTRKQREIEYQLRVELKVRKASGETGLRISKDRIVSADVPKETGKKKCPPHM